MLSLSPHPPLIRRYFPNLRPQPATSPCPGRSTTGDGLLTALLVLDIIHRTGQPLAELTADLKTFPQVIVNVKVREKKPLESIPSVAAAIAAADRALAGTGRVVIRYSGNEALARVMIEAEDKAQMTHHAEAIANAIRAELESSPPASPTK